MNLRATAKTNMSKELTNKIYELCALCEEIKKSLPYDRDYAFTTSGSERNPPYSKEDLRRDRPDLFQRHNITIKEVYKKSKTNTTASGCTFTEEVTIYEL